MMALRLLLDLAILGYGAAGFLLHGYYFFNLREGARKAGFVVFFLTFLLLIGCCGLNLACLNVMPFMLLFLVMTNGLFLALMNKWKTGASASFVAVCAIIIIEVHRVQLDTASPVSPGLFPSPWFYLHIITFLFSYSCFTMAAFSSVLYLYQARLLKEKKLKGAFLRLPSLKELDEASYRFLGLGFPIVALGICFGSLWSHIHSGTYWSFRPGGLTAVIMSIIYLVCIHMRVINRWQGVAVNFILVLSFFLMLIALIVVGHIPL